MSTPFGRFSYLILSPLWPRLRTEGGSVLPQGDTLGPFLGSSASPDQPPPTPWVLCVLPPLPVPPHGRDMGPDRLNCLDIVAEL